MIAKSLDHIAITVSDLDRSVAFYCGLLGMKEVERHRLEGEGISTMAGTRGVVLQVVRVATAETPSVLIDLQQYLAPKGKVSDAHLGDVGHSHFGIGVSDLPSAYRELKEKGVEFISEPVSFDLDWGIVRVVFLKDPDGNILEFSQAPAESK